MVLDKLKSRFYLAVSLILSLSFYSTLASAASFNESSEKVSYIPDMKPYPHLVIQLGGFVANQGYSQNVNINGAVGDYFSVTKHTDSNAFLGLGYYLKGLDTKKLSLFYGIDAFYFPKMTVKGNVTQEQVFTNLNYQYSLTHVPVYFAAKGILKNKYSDCYNLSFDAGLGPNIMKTTNVNEASLDGVTVPDRSFSGRTTVGVSTMVGVGVRNERAFNQMPLECGYRFFYLGKGGFNKRSNQILTTFKTGNTYVNALICSLSF